MLIIIWLFPLNYIPLPTTQPHTPTFTLQPNPSPQHCRSFQTANKKIIWPPWKSTTKFFFFIYLKAGTSTIPACISFQVPTQYLHLCFSNVRWLRFCYCYCYCYYSLGWLVGPGRKGRILAGSNPWQAPILWHFVLCDHPDLARSRLVSLSWQVWPQTRRTRRVAVCHSIKQCPRKLKQSNKFLLEIDRIMVNIFLQKYAENNLGLFVF